jgi:hypothetical protein
MCMSNTTDTTIVVLGARTMRRIDNIKIDSINKEEQNEKCESDSAAKP